MLANQLVNAHSLSHGLKLPDVHKFPVGYSILSESQTWHKNSVRRKSGRLNGCLRFPINFSNVMAPVQNKTTQFKMCVLWHFPLQKSQNRKYDTEFQDGIHRAFMHSISATLIMFETYIVSFAYISALSDWFVSSDLRSGFSWAHQPRKQSITGKKVILSFNNQCSRKDWCIKEGLHFHDENASTPSECV